VENRKNAENRYFFNLSFSDLYLQSYYSTSP